MATNNKFSTEQRRIVWKIRDAQLKQKNAYRRYLNLDIVINKLQNELNGCKLWNRNKSGSKRLKTTQKGLF